MNVLKSVTANRSEPDLIEAGKVENERKSSGFSFFGMRSKCALFGINRDPTNLPKNIFRLKIKKIAPFHSPSGHPSLLPRPRLVLKEDEPILPPQTNPSHSKNESLSARRSTISSALVRGATKSRRQRTNTHIFGPCCTKEKRKACKYNGNTSKSKEGCDCGDSSSSDRASCRLQARGTECDDIVVCGFLSSRLQSC